MNEILLILISGLLATGVMSVTLYLIHWRGLAEADMIRAVGSIITRKESNAMPVGLALHFFLGVIFAFLYVVIWSTLPIDTFSHYVILGLITGFAHGLVVSFMLVILIAEHHPLERFQQAGMGIALAHLVGHIVYGLLVGIVTGLYLVRLDLLPRLID